ncbi:TetR/AcrR family transcriptional regulator [Noviherbaspirillum sedimenti]|uniref:TetR/AcrR family transcriptional regulator n=1 Tax=Noviherbaspirillum sedimenti TaxID=2320865 RepID=A0A3A3G812_9BURK|nr:TetR/AcrR family transcriptional regulator [Noviherbaspirillum sedimenti]RJG02692.1 TetR/AcrR family transcriptional regulator [Noviherbaspirillum sedimenti]
MTRTRAEDYDVKTQMILDKAAQLFAQVGYPAARMIDIAKECGVSKSMLYHYFPAKDDILLAMLSEHADGMISAVEEILGAKGKAEARFGMFINSYLHKSAHARRRHLVAVNDTKFLPKKMQKILVDRERKLLSLLARLMNELNPNLDVDLYKPYALLLIGMLNWIETWYKPGGKITDAELCERVSRLYLRGFLAER